MPARCGISIVLILVYCGFRDARLILMMIAQATKKARLPITAIAMDTISPVLSTQTNKIDEQGFSILIKINAYMNITLVDDTIPSQWRIHSGGGGLEHIFLPNAPKNCMKLKEFGHPGAGACVQNYTM